MEAASELILEKGWEATTAAEIGRRAGYSRAMVSQRFGSKEALLDELLTLDYEDRLMPRPIEGVSGMEQLQTLFRRISEVYTEEPQFLEALFVLGFEATKRGTSVTARMASWINQVADLVEGAVRRGVQDGSFEPGIDIDDAVADIISTIMGVAYGWLVLPDRFDLPRQLDRMAQTVSQKFGG
ncbi:helix-turn-helix transcriptional regulator [Mycolicibacterium neoaurum]|uniref:TetR/AcrR family transcriptional regulator n=1 Tax=Mycolicibacterium neoaurum TaxID=1795 RepID=UPI001BD04F65|nr:TetR/AcrR family transcriptional regulator [Mycolicibacterium neoaurum]QVI27225.1 helix-turn-helix transcriptional regulator [Mycolicibacterium neoaurum]